MDYRSLIDDTENVVGMTSKIGRLQEGYGNRKWKY